MGACVDIRFRAHTSAVHPHLRPLRAISSSRDSKTTRAERTHPPLLICHHHHAPHHTHPLIHTTKQRPHRAAPALPWLCRRDGPTSLRPTPDPTPSCALLNPNKPTPTLLLLLCRQPVPHLRDPPVPAQALGAIGTPRDEQHQQQRGRCGPAAWTRTADDNKHPYARKTRRKPTTPSPTRCRQRRPSPRLLLLLRPILRPTRRHY